ncbi:LuxR C-terminal-related transcriptional regulator [uncultured Piscinibacter sp.]|uniref:LuxR C-terminal-related transcriptional regulator n=1 Tax=uncultured Piscinibacter sp. TaxID=1131835 RepID=UPI00262CB58F|nr:LuxR C-terminal-related transcriptional regulator [uncultured Piscinibacter sp.]
MSALADFALTKLHPPRLRAARVPRAALEARIALALRQHRFVLLSAPAGFGKTAALAAALDSAPATALAWISLDEGDDLQRLLACLAVALEPLDLPWRTAPEVLVAAAGGSGSQRRQAADELVNTLASTPVAQGVIALDDLHRIEDPALFEFVEVLVERLPPAWTLAATARVDPPLPLARWRTAEEMMEFREAELRFDAVEVAALAEAQGGAGVDSAALLERTGGWPAGVRLALRDAAQGARLRDRHAFDYLAAEVLAQMPAALCDFLLRCAELPELSAPRCNALLGSTDAARHLREVERRGPFATAIETGAEPALKLHDLFRDFLEDRLMRANTAGFRTLLGRAADTEPDPARSIGYRLRAGDWARAEAELQPLVHEWLSFGLFAQARRMLDAFPAAWRERSPSWWMLQALCAWANWDFAAMDGASAAALRLADQHGDAATRLRTLAYRALAHVQQDRYDDVEATLAELRRHPLPPEAAVPALTAAVWQTGDTGPADDAAACFAERNEVLAGVDELSLWYEASPMPRDTSLPAMRAPLRRYLDLVPTRALEAPSPLGAIVHLMRGHLALWAGDAATAAEQFDAAEDMSRWLGRPRNLHFMLLQVRSQLAALTGQAVACRELIDQLRLEGEREPEGLGRALLRRSLAFTALRLLLTAGDAAAATAQLDTLQGPEPVEVDTFGQRARRLVVPAYRAELEGDDEAATQAWLRALATRDDLEWYGLRVEARLRAAHACLRTGRRDEARAQTLAAVRRCRDDGLPGSALLAGPTVLSALASIFAGDAELAPTLLDWSEWGQRLRRRVAVGTVARDVPLPAGSLSDRELEVLARIAAGDSNKLIARALDLSPHTVKRHVANILDKLGCSSRGQAAAWHRDRLRH